MHPRCIDENHLVIVFGANAANVMPRGLRFIGNGGNFKADQVIHECRFADIRSPDNRDVATTLCHFLYTTTC